jgi:hypothetical protein
MLYNISPHPRGENPERSDALAVAMPPNTSTLEMLRSIVSVNPIQDGTQHVSELSLGSSDSLLQCCGALRTQPRFSPATLNRNTGSGCALGSNILSITVIQLLILFVLY